MLDARQKWLIRNGITAAVLALLWNTVPVRPFRVLVVFLHEAFHAMAALLTGGGVRMIEVLSHESGVVRLYGGWPLLVYSSGYFGTAFAGCLLIGSHPWFPFKRFLYLGLGMFLLTTTIIFIRNPFGWAYGLVAGGLLIVLFFREFGFSPFITDFVGLLCVLDVIYSMTGFIIAPGRNDAAILSELTGFRYSTVLLTWILGSFALIIGAFLFVYHAMEPARLKAKVEWGDFHIMTRKRMASVGAKKSNYRDEEKRSSRRTLLTYLIVLGCLVILILWASRFVLFQPWTAREWTSAAVVGNRIYIIGGRDREGQVYDEIYSADPVRLKLKKVARLPAPRFGSGVAAIGDKIYIVGGFDGRKYFDDVLVFHAEDRSVTQLSSLPTARCFGNLCASDSALYYAGGWDGEKQRSDILAIDPATGAWTTTGYLPSSREHLCGAFMDGKLYYFGGVDNEGMYLDQMVEVNPADGEITVRGEMPDPKARASAAVLDTPGGSARIIIAGGWEGKKSADVLEMSREEGTFVFRELMTLPQGVSDSPVISLGGFLYVTGGAHEQFNRQIRVFRIDPEKSTVESLKFRNFLFW